MKEGEAFAYWESTTEISLHEDEEEDFTERNTLRRDVSEMGKDIFGCFTPHLVTVNCRLVRCSVGRDTMTSEACRPPSNPTLLTFESHVDEEEKQTLIAANPAQMRHCGY